MGCKKCGIVRIHPLSATPSALFSLLHYSAHPLPNPHISINGDVHDGVQEVIFATTFSQHTFYFLQPLFEERSKIIAGEVAVTSEMVKEGGDFMLKKARNLAEEGETVEMTVPTTVNDEEVKKGIPNFWGTVLENALSEQVYATPSTTYNRIFFLLQHEVFIRHRE